MIGPAYMHPTTARALLAVSRYRTAKARAERQLREELREQFAAAGWPDDALPELVQIHIQLQEAPK